MRLDDLVGVEAAVPCERFVWTQAMVVHLDEERRERLVMATKVEATHVHYDHARRRDESLDQCLVEGRA